MNMSVKSFVAGIQQQVVSPEYVLDPKDYMDSTFPGMRRWHTHWWEISANCWSYPEFYLRQCCGFSPMDYDGSITLDADKPLANSAQGKPVVIVAIDPIDRRWPNPNHLSRMLLEREIHAEQCFFQDNLLDDLAKLHGADLVVTTPGEGQWFAQAVNTPVLMICGDVDARMLKPDYVTGTNDKIPSVYDLATDIEELVKHHGKS